MKIKALLATLIGAVALQGASAGTSWSPPDKGGKCPIDDCPDIGASIAVGYETDYIWNGIRVAEDWLYGDVSYTFDGLGLPITPTIGVYHGTGLSSTFGFDWTQLYADVGLPSVLGIDASLGYRVNLFPTLRAPGGPFGDSFSTISLTLSRDLFAGISGYYSAEYYTGQAIVSDWMHHLGFAKTIGLTDNLGLDLSAGLAYNDDLWGAVGATTGSGFNHYYFQAALPIALNCRATLTPYLGYNGTPDGWKADGIGLPGVNRNDAFHGGVSLRVNF